MSGEWSFITESDPGVVTVFRDGQLAHRTPLDGIEYVVTADINDRGELLVGAQDDEELGHMMLLTPSGSVAWDCTGSTETRAFSPWVRFGVDDRLYSFFTLWFGYFRLVR